MRIKLVCIFLAVTLTVHADERIRASQEELRRRNVYFGEIDGRDTPELHEAVKQYQKRKRFSASGELDPETLRALGLLPRQPDEPAPKELPWPEEPVLKSDVKIDVAGEAAKVAQETGISTSVLVPIASRQMEMLPSGWAQRRPKVTYAVSDPHPSFRLGASASDSKHRSDSSEVNRLVARYLRAVSRNRLRNEIRFYGDKVDYYQNGVVDRRIIEHSLREYYQRWPKHEYRVVGRIRYARLPKTGEILVTAQVEFVLRRGSVHVRGHAVEEFIINAGTSDPRIVSVKERRLHR